MAFMAQTQAVQLDSTNNLESDSGNQWEDVLAQTDLASMADLESEAHTKSKS